TLECLSIDSTTLYRAISNLINNSIEAGAEWVCIQSSVVENKLKLEVSDDGSGFPQEIIESDGAGYASIGKSLGNGIGLSSIRESIMSANGEFSIRNSN